MWIARDKNGSLYAYLNKPKRFEKTFEDPEVSMNLPKDDFKDVSWENSPREITCCPSMLDKLNTYLDYATLEELKRKGEKINTKINNNKLLKSEFVPNIIWEEVRVNAAIQFMASLITDPNIADCEIPSEAVRYANALIKELKK